MPANKWVSILNKTGCGASALVSEYSELEKPSTRRYHCKCLPRSKRNPAFSKQPGLAKAGHIWVYEYLFAKKDRVNIDEDELLQFRKLAKAYAKITEKQIAQLIDCKHFVEICYGNKDQVQSRCV